MVQIRYEAVLCLNFFIVDIVKQAFQLLRKILSGALCIYYDCITSVIKPQVIFDIIVFEAVDGFVQSEQVKCAYEYDVCFLF